MHSLANVAVLLTLLFGIPSFARAQEPKETGTITGRVTLDGKPARDITVIATLSITDSSRIIESFLHKSASLKAATDSDGRYRFEDVPAGKYRLTPFAPTLVSDSHDSGSEVTVNPGNTIEDINFSLSQGGVITGKVTDSDGRPVIGERITLKAVDAPNQAEVTSANAMMSAFGGAGGRMYATDDRGVYRIFGVRAGRYLISAGSDSDVFLAMFKFRPKRTQTFYPGVTDQTKAKQVQVTAGSEASAIDIQFTGADKGFVVSGRVTEAQKGTPIASAMVAYSPARSLPNAAANQKPDDEADNDTGDRVSAVSTGFSNGIPGGFTTTNDRGEFRFESVASGNYKLEISQFSALTGSGNSEFYGDPVTFEVRSSNVERLEVKVHRGASISGVVVAESADGDGGLQSYGRLMVSASVMDAQTKSYSSGSATVGEDGTFRIGGLKAGKATIRLDSIGDKEVALLRIERNGAELPGGVDIQADEQLTGLRMVATQANCLIKGHVTIEGSAPPPLQTVTVRARRMNGGQPDFSDAESAEVDSKGDFVIEDLAPDTYEVEVTAAVPAREGMRNVSAKQTVTTSRAQPAYVSLILNIKGKDQDR